MKIQITEDTFIKGTPVTAGTVMDVDKNTAEDLFFVNRAYELKPGETPRLSQPKKAA